MHIYIPQDWLYSVTRLSGLSLRWPCFDNPKVTMMHLGPVAIFGLITYKEKIYVVLLNKMSWDKVTN